jgi:hypothetical protein
MFFFKPEKETEIIDKKSQDVEAGNKLKNLLTVTKLSETSSLTKTKKQKKSVEKPKKILVEQVTPEMIKEKYEFLSKIINKNKNGILSRMKDFPDIEFLTTEISNDLKSFYFLYETKKQKSDAKFLKSVYLEKKGIDPKQNKCWDKIELFIRSETDQEEKWRTLNEIVPDKYRKKQKIILQNNTEDFSNDISRKRKTTTSTTTNENDLVISKRFFLLGEIVCLLYENQSQSDLEKVLTFLKLKMNKRISTPIKESLSSSENITEVIHSLPTKQEFKSLSENYTTIPASQVNFEEEDNNSS